MKKINNQPFYTKLALTTIILLVHFGIFAQEKSLVKGSVLDKKNTPVPFVTIIASHSGQPKPLSATISNTNGSFQLKLAQGKEYDLTFTSVGYKKTKRHIVCDTVSPLNIGKIIMQQDTLMIGEVNVKPLLQANDFEIIYNISADPEKDSLNLKQIINKLPKIFFNHEGKVKTENGGEVLVTRKGRKDALFRSEDIQTVLSRIPAKAFTTVKIILKPSKHKGEAEYVLDFSPDKSKILIGVLATPSVSYSLNDNAFSPSLSLVGSIDKVRFFANSSVSFTRPPESEYNRTMDDLATNTLVEQQQKKEREGESYNNKLVLSMDVFKKQYLGISFNYNNTETNFNAIEESTTTLADGSITASSLLTNSNNKLTNWRCNIDYELDFDKNERNLSFSYFISAKPNEVLFNKTNEQEGTGNIVLSREVEKNSVDDQKLQLRYTDKLFKKISLATLLSYSDREHTDSWQQYGQPGGTWDTQPSAYNKLSNRVKVLDGSATCVYQTKRIGIVGDININYPLEDKRLYWGSHGIEKQYITNKPLVTVSNQFYYFFKKDKLINSFLLIYTYNQQRPHSFYLSPNKTQLSEGFYQMGNPGLQNPYGHTIVLSIKRKKFMPNFSYYFSDNEIGTVLYKDNDGNMVQSYENNSKYRRFSMGYGQTFKKPASPNFVRVGFNLNYFTETTAYGKTDGITADIETNGAFEIIKKLYASFNFSYRQSFTKGYEKTQYSRPINGSLNLSYSVLKKKKASMRISLSSNPFAWGKRHITTTYTTDEYTQETVEINRRLPLSISVKATFGEFKAPPRTFNSAKMSGFSE
ncbi:MAG: outer membrane beta-barrel protein [Bacteroidota bacterium]